MAHHIDHTPERTVIARHFQAHIKSFLHSQPAHAVFNGIGTDIQCGCDAHFLCQFQTIGVDIRYDDMSCPRMSYNGCGHNTDGARAGNEDILPQDRKTQSSMYGVAKRIKTTEQFLRNGFVTVPHIGLRDYNIFGKSAGTVYTDSAGILA